MFERLEQNRILLTTSDVFDEKGDALNFIDQKNIQVNFNRESSRTELSFEFQEFDVAELLMSEWNRVIEKIVIILIKIDINNSKDETSSGLNMQVSWVPGWKENFNIHTASLMIYSIYSNYYTFAVEFKYENNEEFIKDKEIVNFLRQSRDTEELFCLEEVSFNDSAFIITFQEHTENNGFASIIENFENYSQKIGSYIFVQDKTIEYSSQISNLLKLNCTNSLFISPSLMKLSNFRFSDLIKIHERDDFSPTENFISTQLNFLRSFNLSSIENQGSIYLEVKDIFTQYYPLDVEGEVIYNFQRFRPLRHKCLVSVYGLKVKNNKIGIFTEFLEQKPFLNSMKTLNYKKKLKIFKEIVKLVDFCQKRGYFFIGLDYDHLYFDLNGRVKVCLCYLNRTANKNLFSPEENFGLLACSSENFRLGLLMIRMFLDQEGNNHVLERKNTWISSNIPVFTDQTVKAHPKICQIVSELTGFDPSRRLQCSQLLNMLED